MRSDGVASCAGCALAGRTMWALRGRALAGRALAGRESGLKAAPALAGRVTRALAGRVGSRALVGLEGTLALRGRETVRALVGRDGLALALVGREDACALVARDVDVLVPWHADYGLRVVYSLQTQHHAWTCKCKNWTFALTFDIPTGILQ